MRISFYPKEVMKRFWIGFIVMSYALCTQSQDYLRLMTYNVHHAVGADGKHDLQRIANVILDASPDVVAIQEIDSMTLRHYSHQLGELGVRTRMHATFASALWIGIGKYGIGVLSKERPLRVERLKLPGTEERRALLLVEFDDYIFCCTHLSLTPADRLCSLDIIRTYAEMSDKPFFLAGDFNALPDSEFMHALRNDFLVLNDVEAYTFPAHHPSRTIDYIALWKPTNAYMAVTSSQVIEAPFASDHRPVLVNLRRAVQPDAILVSGPYLQTPIAEMVSVSWVTGVSARGWVEYAFGDTVNLRQVLAYPLYEETVHSADITDLVSGDVLYYRICSQETLGKGVDGHTARSPFYTYVVP